MFLKLSFCDSKWVLQSILSMTVSSNSVSGSSILDTAFLLDHTKSCCVFSDYWIGNLMRISNKCLKRSFCYSKWVLQAVLSLTVKLCSKVAKSGFRKVFLQHSIQLSFTVDFVSDCPFKLCFK